MANPPSKYLSGTKLVSAPLVGTEHVALDAGGAVSAYTTTAAIAALGTAGETANVAAAGATQGTATAIAAAIALAIVSVTASTEGVKLPTAATGKEVTVLAPLTKGFKTYGGAAGQLINANTTATTAFAVVSGQAVTFRGVDATHWRASLASQTGNFGTLNATGLATLSGGLSATGAQKEAVTVVAAAGATQGTATAIPAAAATVNVTTTTSSEGVRLPTASTGRQITVLPPLTLGVKVYGGAAGQLINSGTTATTAYVAGSGKPVEFYAVDATHWRVYNPATALSVTTLAASGLATLSGGMTLSGGAVKEGLTVVSLAGVTQGTAGAIPSTAVLVRVSGTTSANGVKLPTVATGRIVEILGIVGHSFKVYAAAAGQVINAATTATTAYVQATVRPTRFIGVDTAHWQALKSA